MRGDALLLVLGKRFKVERPLVAEAVVHALSPDLHRLDQVAGRGGGKALRPEDGHCPLQHFVAIEFSWPHHGRHLTLFWTDVSISAGVESGLPTDRGLSAHRGEPDFQEARVPSRAELEGLLDKIIARLIKALTRLGYL